jgi:hypothetical protein
MSRELKEGILVKNVNVPKRYREHFDLLNSIVESEVGGKSDELLRFRISSVDQDEESECLFVTYEAWLVRSDAPRRDVVFEETAWFEIAPSVDVSENINFEIIEWHDGGYQEYSVIKDRLPRGIFLAWLKLHEDDLYYLMVDSDEDLKDCRPCAVRAFRRYRRELEEIEKVRSAESSQKKGKINTGMLGPGSF